MSNKYLEQLEKTAAVSTVGKAWIRGALNSLTKNPASALSAANSKAKAIAGNSFHKAIHSGDELKSFANSKVMASAQSKGLTPGEANRAVKLATGLAQRKLKYQG